MLTASGLSPFRYATTWIWSSGNMKCSDYPSQTSLCAGLTHILSIHSNLTSKLFQNGAARNYGIAAAVTNRVLNVNDDHVVDAFKEGIDLPKRDPVDQKPVYDI